MDSNLVGVRIFVSNGVLSKYPSMWTRKDLARMIFFGKVCYAMCKDHTIDNLPLGMQTISTL